MQCALPTHSTWTSCISSAPGSLRLVAARMGKDSSGAQLLKAWSSSSGFVPPGPHPHLRNQDLPAHEVPGESWRFAACWLVIWDCTPCPPVLFPYQGSSGRPFQHRQSKGRVQCHPGWTRWYPVRSFLIRKSRYFGKGQAKGRKTRKAGERREGRSCLRHRSIQRRHHSHRHYSFRTFIWRGERRGESEAVWLVSSLVDFSLSESLPRGWCRGHVA